MVGIACCSRVELEEYIAFVSNFHPALQFTHTISETELPFLDINLRISGDHIRTSIHYKATDTHSYLHYDSSHPRHCKQSLPYSQLLRLRRICSDQADFLNKAQEMASFFERRGYSAQTLKHDLEKMKQLSQSDALTKSNSTKEKMNRIPLILTYHPLNSRVQRILLDNFKVIADDPATSFIFPQPPMVAFRRDGNLRSLLVHTAEKQAATRAGTYPCQHPRCRTCGHISNETDLLGPKDHVSITDSFTCLSSGLIYCISCRRCPAIYIGETGRTLRERFGEHLRSIDKNAPGFPVAEHFSSNGHTADDALVRGIKLCEGNKQRKRQEMRLIFRLGTCQPRGLNADFHFI